MSDSPADPLHFGWLVDAEPTLPFVYLQVPGGRVLLHLDHLADAPPVHKRLRRSPDLAPLRGDLAFVFALAATGERYPAARRARPVDAEDVQVVAAALAAVSWDVRDAVWRCLPPTVREGVLDDHLAVAPPQQARHRLQTRYRALVDWLRQGAVRTRAPTTIDAADIQARRTGADARLVAAWAEAPWPEVSEYDRLRLISARRAEHAAHLFFAARGLRTEDVSRQRLSGDDRWRAVDLRVVPPHPGLPVSDLEVLNLRRVRGRAHAPAVCVPAYKRDRQAPNVGVLGCVSEYRRSLDDARRGMGDVVVLGWFTPAVRARLEAQTQDVPVDLRLQRPGHGAHRVAAPWLFSLPGRRWPPPPAGLSLAPLPWLERLDLDPLPLWLAAGRALPEVWTDAVPAWARSLWDRLRGVSALPDLYLGLLVDLLVRLEDPRAEWDRAVVRRLLSWQRDPDHPLGLHDPTGAVWALLDALHALWQHRSHLRCRGYTRFRLTRPLWVQGRTSGRWETLLVYCGGQLDGGPCGHWPLVRGRDAACGTCGLLVCPVCGTCARTCPAGTARVEARAQQRAEGRAVHRLRRGRFEP